MHHSHWIRQICANRLTFGGSPHPPNLSDLSEAATDLCNKIAQLQDRSLTERVYRWCLPWIFHVLVTMKNAHPETSILIGTYDLD
jgi:hypothetical protein